MSKETKGASTLDAAGDAQKLPPEVEALLNDAADKAEAAQATIGQLTADLTAEREKAEGLFAESGRLSADLDTERADHVLTREKLDAAAVKIDQLTDELTSARNSLAIGDLFTGGGGGGDEGDFDLTEGVYVLTTSKITDSRDEQIPRGRLITVSVERGEALVAAFCARAATSEDLRAATHPPVVL